MTVYKINKKKPTSSPHQAVPLKRLDQGAVSVRVQHQALRNVLHEVKVFKCWPCLLSLFSGGPALVCGTLEVIFKVHAYHPGQDVVHHHHPDVLSSGLHAVQTEKLWQQCARVLVKVL